METWLNHRTFLDCKLLLHEFLIFDWIVVAGFGFLMGLCIAWQRWHVSKKTLNQLEEERKYLLSGLRSVDTPEKENVELQPELIKIEEEEESEDVASGADDQVVVLHGPTPFQADDGVVFVLDVSRSMKRFIKYFKFVLQQGVEALLRLNQSAPPKYQVIFFSGPAWFAHQEIIEPKKEDDPYVVEDPDDEGVRIKWTRVQNRLNTFKSEDGIENLPKGNWREATPHNIEQTIQRIKLVRLHPGTTWHRPLILAMNLDPPPKRIDFLTDGRTANQMQVAEDVIDMVKLRGGNTIINTFGPFEASEGLRYIARQTGGEYTEFGSSRTSKVTQEEQDFLPGMELSKVVRDQ